MKHLILIIGLLAVSPASAACYADYKAKKDSPLQLHYGVIQLPDSACSASMASGVIRQRIKGDGWKLLKVLSVFHDDGLDGRKNSAGAYYLRY